MSIGGLLVDPLQRCIYVSRCYALYLTAGVNTIPASECIVEYFVAPFTNSRALGLDQNYCNDAIA